MYNMHYPLNITLCLQKSATCGFFSPIGYLKLHTTCQTVSTLINIHLARLQHRAIVQNKNKNKIKIHLDIEKKQGGESICCEQDFLFICALRVSKSRPARGSDAVHGSKTYNILVQYMSYSMESDNM